ncbi:hypothetical protein HHI36_022248 [Cryptolaemus montrouzieri]|uniref:Cytosolic fatty-acid binding proteins domain-containing protein n=1 Tax=Cryptolaemus montrouzieri TaxID=559131 RepID=A0ABD2MZB3_9CUCU
MATLDEFLNKRYKLVESVNFDNYMKSLGAGFLIRKIANKITPVLELTKEGEEYIISQKTTFKNIIIKFKPGVEFDQETPDGRIVKTVMTIEGNKVHEVQNIGSGKVIIVDRVFTDSEVKMTMQNGDVSATRIYKLET